MDCYTISKLWHILIIVFIMVLVMSYPAEAGYYFDEGYYEVTACFHTYNTDKDALNRTAGVLWVWPGTELIRHGSRTMLNPSGRGASSIMEVEFIGTSCHYYIRSEDFRKNIMYVRRA